MRCFHWLLCRDQRTSAFADTACDQLLRRQRPGRVLGEGSQLRLGVASEAKDPGRRIRHSPLLAATAPRCCRHWYGGADEVPVQLK